MKNPRILKAILSDQAKQSYLHASLIAIWSHNFVACMHLEMSPQ